MGRLEPRMVWTPRITSAKACQVQAHHGIGVDPADAILCQSLESDVLLFNAVDM
jgi:hypothetical protein